MGIVILQNVVSTRSMEPHTPSDVCIWYVMFIMVFYDLNIKFYFFFRQIFGSVYKKYKYFFKLRGGKKRNNFIKSFLAPSFVIIWYCQPLQCVSDMINGNTFYTFLYYYSDKSHFRTYTFSPYLRNDFINIHIPNYYIPSGWKICLYIRHKCFELI